MTTLADPVETSNADSVHDSPKQQLVGRMVGCTVRSPGMSRGPLPIPGLLTLSHAGDFGDLVYSGPLLRAMAIKHHKRIDLVLYPAPFTRAQHDARAAENVLGLMRSQPYIGRARFSELPEGICLDGGQHSGWRSLTMYGGMSLAEMHLQYYGFDPALVNEPWIERPEPRRVHAVIIHRSPRYHGMKFPWPEVLKKYAGHLGMVGMTHEHDAFCKEFGPVPYVETANGADLAAVIAGADLFVGNQSFPYAVAEGMKVNTVQETFPYSPDCLFDRHNAAYGIGRWIVLPDIAAD